MIRKSADRTAFIEECAEKGEGILRLDKLLLPPDSPAKVRMYAKATLEPGASVGYHTHHNESESYFILSGKGEYNDDGEISTVLPGDITFTPDGHGHGIKNIGDDELVFMALIVLD